MEEHEMLLRSAIPATLVLLTATAAFAADTFYIVQDKEKKTCTVVKEKPKADTLLGIELLGLEFKTQVEAEEAVKTTKVCVTEK
jgi:hypothetical protein